MKIGVVYQGKFPPEKGASGSDRRVRDITRGLAQGNMVHMLVPRWNKSSKENQDADDFEINYLGGTDSKSNSIMSRISFWKAVRMFVKKNELDSILFYNTSFESIPTAYQLKNRGYKVAYEICDLPSSNIKGFKKHLVELGENYLPKVTNLNIAISKFLEDKVLESAPNTQSLRIPILVDSDTFQFDESKAKRFRAKYNIIEDEIVIAYAGGTWKQEGVRYLVDAFNALSKERKNIRLAIAGRLIKKSEAHDDIEGLLEKYNLGDRIIAMGWVSTEDILELYSAAYILALPQIDNVFNIAGLPTKLAEYSSMGKAIVATDVGDVKTYFEDGKNIALCEAANSDSLKETLAKVIDDQGLYKTLASGAKKVAMTQFDFRVCGNKIINELKNLK